MFNFVFSTSSNKLEYPDINSAESEVTSNIILFKMSKALM